MGKTAYTREGLLLRVKERRQQVCEFNMKGPWDEESDFLQFPVQDFAAILMRTEMLNWCGYIGVPVWHPLFGRKENDSAIAELEVHGGITFTGLSDEIRYVASPSEKNWWWIGFDCAHGWDYVPGLEYTVASIMLKNELEREIRVPNKHHTYRDTAYVKAEIEHLARQVKQMTWWKIMRTHFRNWLLSRIFNIKQACLKFFRGFRQRVSIGR